RDKLGRTALTRAALNDCGDVVALLCENNADVNAQSGDGETALIKAARFGRIRAVSALLAAGARLDIRSNEGHTAVEVAAYGETALLLREAGATDWATGSSASRNGGRPVGIRAGVWAGNNVAVQQCADRREHVRDGADSVQRQRGSIWKTILPSG